MAFMKPVDSIAWVLGHWLLNATYMVSPKQTLTWWLSTETWSQFWDKHSPVVQWSFVRQHFVLAMEIGICYPEVALFKIFHKSIGRWCSPVRFTQFSTPIINLINEQINTWFIIPSLHWLIDNHNTDHMPLIPAINTTWMIDIASNLHKSSNHQFSSQEDIIRHLTLFNGFILIHATQCNLCTCPCCCCIFAHDESTIEHTHQNSSSTP